tara:strand:+ start:3335 stop:3529 length:195 start_codon:yes stop_codon:yes gene_type:complete
VSESDIEVDRIREVATDRLMFMRLMEKSINQIDAVLGSLKSDIQELSMQIAQRDAAKVEGKENE